jgi:hypothetical protein
MSPDGSTMMFESDRMFMGSSGKLDVYIATKLK